MNLGIHGGLVPGAPPFLLDTQIHGFSKSRTGPSVSAGGPLYYKGPGEEECIISLTKGNAKEFCF